MAAVHRFLFLRQVLVACLILVGTSIAASAATTTTLAITSGGNPATTVAAGTVVTLTASVNAGAVTTGLVDFCDATAVHCTDVHILGSAQLTSSGTAAFKFIPAIGQHSLNALFVGTTSNAGSTSGPETLAVTGLYPTTTTITQVTGQQGNYTLTESMVGNGSTAPTAPLSLLDTTSNNASIATAPLGAITASSAFVSEPFTGVTGQAFPTVAGDFNGDGVPDVAVLGTDINILIGNGDGTFHAGPTPTATGVQWIVAADFNGDGKLDLATANANNTVTVLLGNGDGTFTVSSPTQIPAGLSNMYVGDFNGDGKPDLILPGPDGSNADFILNVLLGNGDGTFTAGSQKSTASPALPSLCVGDFNGDGKDDIGIAGDSPSISPSNYNSGVAAILLSNGDGTFTTSTPFALDENGSAVAAIDFNGDGKLDLVAGTYANPPNISGYRGELYALSGNGDGTLSFRNEIAISDPYAIGVADFNGDGKADIVVASPMTDQGGDPGGIFVLFGDGTGAFSNGPQTADPAGFNQGFAIADFNGDGLPDLAPYLAASVLLYENTQSATVAETNIAPPGTGPHKVEASYPGDSAYVPSTSSTVTLMAGTPAIVIAPATLPAGTVRSPYSQTLTVKGGTAPYQYVLSAGNLPGGLTLTSAGVLSGTPALPGVYSVSITATDSTVGTPNTNTILYIITVQTAPPPTFTFSPGTLPAGTVGTAYSQTISYTVTDGTPPYTWVDDTTTLPPGLSFNTATGTLSGTPTASGQYPLTFEVTDSSPDGPFSASTGYTLTINPAPVPAFSITSAPGSATVTAGQSAKYTLTFNPSDGFSGAIALTCGALPAETSCSFAPASVTVSNASAASVLTITTTAATTAALHPAPAARPVTPGSGPVGRGLSGAALAALLLLYIPKRFRGKQRWPALLGAILAVGALSGCGGGSSSTNPPASGGTPVGTSIVTITGSSQGVIQEVNLTLIVQ